MKTILVLAQHPQMAEAVRTSVSASDYKVVERATVEEAEPLLEHGLADACIVDVEVPEIQGIWFLEKLRRRSPRCPILIYTGAKGWDWEEEAYLKGAAQVLTKPVRGRMLTALLDRLWLTQTARPAFGAAAGPAESGRPESSSPAPPSTATTPAPAQTLGVLRDFSAILSHSLNAEAMLRQFLLLLREILSINRAAIFLRQPLTSFGAAAGAEESRRLRAAAAVGLSPGLLQHFDLSFDAGIGGHLFRHGRILRRSADEVRNDSEAQKEFELLGAQVAVPILDRETVLGVAVFDGRITGESLVNAELQLIFHLLEQLGLAVKNISLHDQLANNHAMMVEILRELSSACVVVSRDLSILHANKMARKYFATGDRRSEDLEFSSLPQVLGAKVYQVLKTGSAISGFKYRPENPPGAIYNVNVVPFQRMEAGLPASALLLAEDLTEGEQLKKLELETSSLRQLRTMADRLTHELGNAMVPLSVHQQMLAEMLGRADLDVEFLKSMEHDWAEGVKRASRLISQMRFLARDTTFAQESFPLGPLLAEALEEARKHQPVKTAQLKYDNTDSAGMLTGDREALKHALAELMLNALQANPADARIDVRMHLHSNGSGTPAVQIEVVDNGAGFSDEAARNAFAPFFTTRNVGLGLGLTVSQRIIEAHRGRLEIIQTTGAQVGMIRISLPAESPAARS